MGALAIAVLLVLVIRLGVSRSADKANKDLELSEESNELLNVLNQAGKPRPSSRSLKKEQDRVLDNLVAEGFEEESNGPPEPSKNESFDDIRKSLGLE
jgi:hypothetical protein